MMQNIYWRWDHQSSNVIAAKAAIQNPSVFSPLLRADEAGSVGVAFAATPAGIERYNV
jgi:hypothetical protein